MVAFPDPVTQHDGHGASSSEVLYTMDEAKESFDVFLAQKDTQEIKDKILPGWNVLKWIRVRLKSGISC